VKILLIILFFVNASTVNAKTFSVTNLANSATSEDCLDYCVDGVCFWLVCGWGCSVKTTPHINHNLPDFVVSSYNEPGENSFSEVQSLFELTSFIPGTHVLRYNMSLKPLRHIFSSRVDK
jgi:hypothetical protein